MTFIYFSTEDISTRRFHNSNSTKSCVRNTDPQSWDQRYGSIDPQQQQQQGMWQYRYISPQSLDQSYRCIDPQSRDQEGNFLASLCDQLRDGPCTETPQNAFHFHSFFFLSARRYVSSKISQRQQQQFMRSQIDPQSWDQRYGSIDPQQQQQQGMWRYRYISPQSWDQSYRCIDPQSRDQEGNFLASLCDQLRDGPCTETPRNSFHSFFSSKISQLEDFTPATATATSHGFTI